MSLRLKGTAWPTNSGSLSEAKVVPLLASESPSLLMANFLTEQPFTISSAVSAKRKAAGPNSERERSRGARKTIPDPAVPGVPDLLDRFVVFAILHSL